MLVPELLMMDFATREEAGAAVAELIAAVLREELEHFGNAVFLSSGGSTPKQMLDVLSKATLDWSKVQVGLVDDRCVSAQHEASNARLIKRALLKNNAASAHFVPMIDESMSISELAARAGAHYKPLLPPTFTLLGMGTDGHTASWFPGSVDLQKALSATDDVVVAIDADGCEVAGEITDRLTLSRSAVAASKRAVLMIFGDEKREVFLNAMTKPIEEAPIRAAIEDLGDRLITAWAP